MFYAKSLEKDEIFWKIYSPFARKGLYIDMKLGVRIHVAGKI